MTQHEMRRIALQALYLANQEPELDYDDVVTRTVKALDLKDFPEFSDNLLKGILGQRSELDEELSKYLKSGWRIERLSGKKTSMSLSLAATRSIVRKRSLSLPAAFRLQATRYGSTPASR